MQNALAQSTLEQSVQVNDRVAIIPELQRLSFRAKALRQNVSSDQSRAFFYSLQLTSTLTKQSKN